MCNLRPYKLDTCAEHLNILSNLREDFPLFSAVYAETQNEHTMNTLPEYLGRAGEEAAVQS